VSVDHPIYVGIIGYGKIGSGTYKTLLDNQESIDRKVGRPVRVKRLVDVDWSRRRPVEIAIPDEMQATEASAVLDDPEIAIVVECIGGTDPALDLVLGALRAGKNVVTSNKELIARHGKELFDAAAQRGLDAAGAGLDVRGERRRGDSGSPAAEELSGGEPDQSGDGDRERDHELHPDADGGGGGRV